MILTMFAIFFLTMLIGFPIAFCLGLSSAFYLIIADIPLNIIPQRMFSGIDSFADAEKACAESLKIKG